MIAKTKDVFSRNAGAHPTVERGRLATGRGHLRTNIFLFYFFFSFLFSLRTDIFLFSLFLLILTFAFSCASTQGESSQSVNDSAPQQRRLLWRGGGDKCK